MKNFSQNWVSSKKPRKQRKYLANAPLNIRKDFLRVQLSKPLREKHNRRNVLARKGDRVRIMRGQFAGTQGNIEDIDYKLSRVYLNEASVVKKDGTKSNYPLHPSNLQILELTLDDKRRVKSINRTVSKK